MKGVSLITKGRNTCSALVRQLRYFLGESVSIDGYYIDGNIKDNIQDNLIVISSAIIYSDAIRFVDKNSRVTVARRSVNYHEIYKLFTIPPGTDVLLVNDLEPTTYETILELRALGLDHINYFPYYPMIRNPKRLGIAVTPGERELVPDYVNTIIDIGSRNIDLTTMVEIFKVLNIPDERIKLLSANYIKDIIDLIKKTHEMAYRKNLMSNQLQTIINAVHDGIVALDQNGIITVFNPIAEEMFHYGKEEIIGKSLRDLSSKESISSVLANTLEQESIVKINRKYVVLNCTPIEGDDAGGTVYTLKDVTEIQRLEEELRRRLLSAGKYARYTFDDIAGNSAAIISAKGLAKSLAKSQSNILIQGESGTGKELFAQAVHNMSPREKGPFVAINFAALPESLLESELFGYEEGAFTGAKKGGKPGLFEQAHGGTVFLDEIGDAPLYFQVRLLRVLQEKQVQRIGSSEIIPIDIRVISATHRDLRALIEKSMFRQDLYYRLNVLPLTIPPLRERREDILTLATIFYLECFQGCPPIEPQKYFEHVRDNFIAYNWPGNIRELHNIVEYLANISPDTPLSPELLPQELKSTETLMACDSSADLLLKQILSLIAQANIRGEPIGRRSLSKKAALSESSVRRLLTLMSEEGLIQVQRGRRGLLLTKKGESILSDGHILL